MHDAAPLIASTAVIVVGILAGILFNQRAIDKLDSRIDKMEAEMRAGFAQLSGRIDRVQADLSQFYRTLGQHDEAIDALKKRS